MTFSDAILLMDVSPLWAILFFLMLILLGIDSEFGTLEAAIGPIIDLKIFPKMRKELLTLLVAVILFLVGLCMVSGPGFYIFQMFDDYSVTIPLLVIALFQCIGVAWVYGNDRYETKCTTEWNTHWQKFQIVTNKNSDGNSHKT